VAHKTTDHLFCTFCATNIREDEAMPEHEFQIYLSVLSRLMKLDEQQKSAIADELSDHLEERFEELVRSGMDRDEAIRQALDEFGDASGLAIDLTRVSQKRIRRIIMRSSLATAALLLIGFGWMFLFPPGNGEVDADSQLVAQDSPATPDTTTPPDGQPVARVKISLDRDTTDFDAPFLKETTTVNFSELPLDDALDFISRSHEFPILLDVIAVEEAGLLADEPINLVFAPVRVDQVLDLMLSDLELTWFVEDGILHVTTIEVANQRLVNRSYDLAPFRAAGIAPGALLEIVMQATDALWEEIDGSGGLISIVGDVMTIRQSYQAHRHIPHLLEAIIKPTELNYGIYHDQKAACLRALQKPVTVNFADTPLTDVADYLSRTLETAIFLDTVAIEEAGLLVDEPVSFVMSGQSVATTLRLILSEFELTIVVRSGELCITTIEVANERLHSVVYDVRKIQEPRQVVPAVMSLTDGSWEEVDGRGGALSLTENGLLVVQQTEETHREIAAVLKMFLAKGPNQTPYRVRRTLETRLYRVPSETAEDLMSALPATVAPETWHVDGEAKSDADSLAVGTIRKVAVGQKAVELVAPKTKQQDAQGKKPEDAGAKGAEKSTTTPPPEVILVSESVLVIKQTAAVHNEINNFIRSLNLGVASLGRKAALGGGAQGVGCFGSAPNG
jgi:hypothetical protein